MYRRKLYLVAGQNIPVRFSSSWLLFVKASALNIFPPDDLINLVRRRELSALRKPPYWSSDFVDVPSLAEGLQFDYALLSTLFVEPYSSSCTDKLIIRHCPSCIAKGYHSVFFQFWLFDVCPWHGMRLQICSSCTNALHNNKGVEFELHEDFYTAKLKCGHFFYDSRGSSYFGSMLEAQERQDLMECSALCAKWLTGCVMANAPFVSGVTRLFDNTHSDPNLSKLIRSCFRLAQRIVGTCPWRVKLDDAEDVFTTYTVMRVASLGCVQTKDLELKPLLNSIRRYLLRRFLHGHRQCLRFYRKLSSIDMHCLDAQAACSAAAAFIVWERSIFYQDGENWQYPPHKVSVGWVPSPDDPTQIANLWLLHFYTIWRGIERNCQRCASIQDRFSVELASSSPPLRLGNNCLVNYSLQPRTVIFSALIPSNAELMRAADARCACRRQMSDMINHQSTFTANFWTYEQKERVWMRFWVGDDPKRGGWWQPVDVG